MNANSMDQQPSFPGQAAAEAEETLNQGRDASGGNALLDAEVEVSQDRPSDEVLAQPIATDIAGNTDTDDPTDAKNFNTTGAYPVDQNRLEND